MNKNLIILQFKKIGYERKIEKLKLSINGENKKAINKIINKLKNKLDLIEYELEKVGGNQ